MANYNNWPEDYRGVKFDPSLPWLWKKCEVCDSYVYHGSVIHGLCPPCTLKLSMFWLEITFEKSKSRNYKKALKIYNQIPVSCGGIDEHMLIFDSVPQFVKYKSDFSKLFKLIYKWKSFRATLNGLPLEPRQVQTICNALHEWGLGNA